MVAVACFLPGRAKDLTAPPHKKKNTEALAVVSREIGLEVYAEKTTYMVIPRDQNAGQNNITVGNNTFERVK